MFLEIIFSGVAKYPEFFFFFDALKLAKTEYPIFFKKLASQKSMFDYLKIFKTKQHFKFEALHSQKALSSWQMKLSLDKVAQIVLGVKYAKYSKIQRLISHVEDNFFG